MLAILDDLHANEHINICRTPLFRTLLGHQFSYEFEPQSKSSGSSRPRPQSHISSGNLELQVLKHRNQTVVTTVVSRVTKLLFEQNIKLVDIPGQDDIDMDELRPTLPSLVHLANPNSVKWGLPTDYPGCYQFVCVDGVVYSVRLSVLPLPFFISFLDW